VEQLAVGASADLIDDGGLEVEEDGTGDVLASAGLGEEGVVSVVLDTNGLVGGHGAIGLNAMFEKFPIQGQNLQSSQRSNFRSSKAKTTQNTSTHCCLV
jgi:hypothetical protein